MQRERQAVNDLLWSISSLFPQFNVKVWEFETNCPRDNNVLGGTFLEYARLSVEYLDTEFVEIEFSHGWGESEIGVKLDKTGRRHCVDIRKIDTLREMISNRIENTLQYKFIELEQVVRSAAPMKIFQLN